MNNFGRNLLFLIFAACAFVSSVDGQVRRELSVAIGATVEIVNHNGKVEVTAVPTSIDDPAPQSILNANGKTPISESELAIVNTRGSVRVETRLAARGNRVDITLSVPERTKVKITTTDGEIRVSGNLELIEATTETGTIAADVPSEDVRYEMVWRESRPRFLSDFELEKAKERSAGRFSISGKYKGEPETPAIRPDLIEPDSEGNGEAKPKAGEPAKLRPVSLKFTTDRGIVLLNVPPNEVMNDLRERPLTEAAKSIIRSGDTVLTDAIRRASPKYFGEYARTLPPHRREPGLNVLPAMSSARASTIKLASLRVTDLQNRAISGLTKDDLEAAESGEPREILAVRQSTAPVNLVLLLDVSGSVDNYVNFIRKAARAFVETVDRRDRVSLIIFNEDVKELATFSTDKGKLSASLDTFDAGGGTAYYDAIGYTLTDTLRSLRGERTAIVVLSDGDDNRSFLPFESLIGAVEESGALIYPLYVPTSLIAAAASDPNTAVDPLRSRYLSSDITSKADAEGKRLAEVSGGVYYPITQLSQIQTAYEDIVAQLRTSYDVQFRSEFAAPDGKPSPRLKIRSKKPNMFVQIRSVSTLTR
jgi:VWFA-related protein